MEQSKSHPPHTRIFLAQELNSQFLYVRDVLLRISATEIGIITASSSINTIFPTVGLVLPESIVETDTELQDVLRQQLLTQFSPSGNNPSRLSPLNQDSTSSVPDEDNIRTDSQDSSPISPKSAKFNDPTVSRNDQNSSPVNETPLSNNSNNSLFSNKHIESQSLINCCLKNSNFKLISRIDQVIVIDMAQVIQTQLPATSPHVLQLNAQSSVIFIQFISKEQKNFVKQSIVSNASRLQFPTSLSKDVLNQDGKETQASTNIPSELNVPALDMFKTIAEYYNTKFERYAKIIKYLEDRVGDREEKLVQLTERYNQMEESSVILLEKLRDSVAQTERLSLRLAQISSNSSETQTRVDDLEHMLLAKRDKVLEFAESFDLLEQKFNVDTTEDNSNIPKNTEKGSTVPGDSSTTNEDRTKHRGFVPRISATKRDKKDDEDKEKGKDDNESDKPSLLFSDIKPDKSAMSFFNTYDSLFKSLTTQKATDIAETLNNEDTGQKGTASQVFDKVLKKDNKPVDYSFSFIIGVSVGIFAMIYMLFF